MPTQNLLDISRKDPQDVSYNSLPIIEEDQQLKIQSLEEDDEDDSNLSFAIINQKDNQDNQDDSILESRQNSSSSLNVASIDDDISNLDSRSATPKTQQTRFKHQRNFSDASFLSYLPNVDESSYSLGFNKLSEATVSPLGKNSVFELVQNLNYNRKATTTGLLSIYSSSATINLKGPTSRDIPPTHLSKITKVKPTQFRPYLNSIEGSYRKFQSNKTLTESTLEAFMNQLNEEEKKNRFDYSITSDVGITEEEEYNLDSNSLSNIPKIYFSEDFRLDDPRVFNEVTENSTILNDTTDFNEDGTKKVLIDNSDLQDKLSSYLDIIEIRLIHEISKSSGSFFSALDDLKAITKKSKDLTTQLKSMDSKLSLLEKNQANVALDILKLTQKRNNTEKLEQSLLQIFTIMHQADLAEASYFNANYEKALELTDSVFALIRGNSPPHPIISKLTSKWPHPLLDMNKVPALVPLKRLLMNLVSDTGKSYAKLFVDFLINDLRDHYENIPKAETVNRLSNNLSRNRSKRGSSLNFKYQQMNDSFKIQLKEYMTGLTRCGEIVSAFKLYEERFLTEVKTIIKSNLPNDILELRGQTAGSISGRSDGTKSTTTQQSGIHGLGNTVKAMTPKEFEDMLIIIDTQLSEALRRLTVHKKVLLDMALDSLTATDARFMDNQPDLVVQLDITTAISNAIDVSQRRMAKIINVREAQNASISLDYFLRFYSINVMLLIECELISGGSSATSILQDIINIQLQKFSNQFYKTSLKSLSERIEKELWKECLLPSSTQLLLNEIMEAANEDFAEEKWMKSIKITGTDKVEETRPEAEQRKSLMINEKSIIVPEVATSIIKLIQSYELLKIQFPNSDDTNIIDFFRLLNLKIHQSVLGAQATKTAGLKHITSKHLAVASQFLDFLTILVPFVKLLFGRLTKADKFRADEFDKIEQLFDDHKTEIFNKLVSIMTDRVNIHATEIKSTDWSQLLPQQQVHKYMETLIKETLTIARVLQRYLPELQYSSILSRIFEQYKRSLIDIYSQIKLKDSIDKAVMMKDIDYFREKLADVTGYGNSGQVIWENVNALPTDEDTRMEQRMRSNYASAENSVDNSAFNSRANSATPKITLTGENKPPDKLTAPSLKDPVPFEVKSEDNVHELTIQNDTTESNVSEFDAEEEDVDNSIYVESDNNGSLNKIAQDKQDETEVAIQPTTVVESSNQKPVEGEKHDVVEIEQTNEDVTPDDPPEQVDGNDGVETTTNGDDNEKGGDTVIKLDDYRTTDAKEEPEPVKEGEQETVDATTTQE